jgi:hypothetical protein
VTAGIGAAGIVGIAHEVTPGTYVAPTKFVPILSESLTRPDEIVWRRPIRATADVVSGVGGNVHVEGDLVMEVFEDVLPYFLYCARTVPVKSGSTPNFIYTFTPAQSGQPATPQRTMSVTVVRNGQVFGYTGCVVSSYNITVADGLMQATFSMLGNDEATQTPPIATWPTSVPFGAGAYSIEVPTATQVFDVDVFTFTVEDNGTPQYRLKNTGRGAQFITYGERNCTVELDRDFGTRAEFDEFKALTSRSVTITASKGINNSVSMSIPVGTRTDYPVNLSAQGDIIRASVTFQSSIDGTGNVYTIVVKTQEVIT